MVRVDKQLWRARGVPGVQDALERRLVEVLHDRRLLAVGLVQDALELAKGRKLHRKRRVALDRLDGVRDIHRWHESRVLPTAARGNVFPHLINSGVASCCTAVFWLQPEISYVVFLVDRFLRWPTSGHVVVAPDSLDKAALHKVIHHVFTVLADIVYLVVVLKHDVVFGRHASSVNDDGSLLDHRPQLLLGLRLSVADASASAGSELAVVVARMF